MLPNSDFAQNLGFARNERESDLNVCTSLGILKVLWCILTCTHNFHMKTKEELPCIFCSLILVPTLVSFTLKENSPSAYTCSVNHCSKRIGLFVIKLARTYDESAPGAML